MSSFSIQTFCTHCLCFHIPFSQSHHKQLNEDLKRITLVMLAVHEKVALISSSQSKTRQLLYVHEQFAMSLHLFVFHYYMCGCCYVQTASAAEDERYLICHLSALKRFAETLCVCSLIYIYIKRKNCIIVCAWLKN